MKRIASILCVSLLLFACSEDDGTSGVDNVVANYNATGKTAIQTECNCYASDLGYAGADACVSERFTPEVLSQCEEEAVSCDASSYVATLDCRSTALAEFSQCIEGCPSQDAYETCRQELETTLAACDEQRSERLVAAIASCSTSDSPTCQGGGAADAGPSDTSTSDVADASPADTSVPDTSVPDTSVPDTSVPDTSVPDTSVPDTSVPDASPDVSPDVAPDVADDPVCGDGRVEGNETCDDGPDNGTYGSCNSSCDGRAAYCGDGVMNGPEECDGSDLAGQTCQAQGWLSGSVSCTNGCRLDTSACEMEGLVFTEAMVNPAGFFLYEREWFELKNTTGAPINLQNCKVTSAGDGGVDEYTVTSSVTVPAGGYVTFAYSADPGFVPDVNYAGAMILSNSSDYLEVFCPGPSGLTSVDKVDWDDATFPIVDAASMSLDPTKVDPSLNDSGSNWCLGSTIYDGADMGTPGSANDPC